MSLITPNTNTIIAHLTADVKVEFDNNTADQLIPTPARIQSSSKWAVKKQATKKRAVMMAQAGFLERAIRIMSCSDTISYSYCPECGHYVVKRATLCRDKLCPVCTWRLAIQRTQAMRDIISRCLLDIPSARWYFATFTVPNADVDQLSACLAAMSDAWKRLSNRRLWRRHIIGWARSVEITYNADTWQMHPHYHVILMADSTPEAQLFIRQLAGAWCETYYFNGGKANTLAQDVREIILDYTPKPQITKEYIKAILEAYKYTVKDSDIDNMPLSVYQQFVGQIQNVRMTSFGGYIKNVKAELHADLDEIQDIDQDITVCDHCGADAMIDEIARWSYNDNQYHAIVNDLSLTL